MDFKKLTALLLVSLFVIASAVSVGCSHKKKMCKGMSFYKRDLKRTYMH